MSEDISLILTAIGLVPITIQEAVVLQRPLDLAPIDVLHVTQIIVLQNGDRAGMNFLQGAKSEGYQRGFHDVQ